MSKELKLTKAKIVDEIAETTDISRRQIHTLINVVFNQINTSLIQGHSVELRGFGTFLVKKRKKRDNARNPKTGEKVAVKEHSVVVFRSGKSLKSAVWNI